MLQLIDRKERPGLLVSVRDASEALAALAGGAQVIDVKEPDRGSLGAADADTIAAVIGAVAGRAPVTAAAGELVDWMESAQRPMPAGLSLFKIGLAGTRGLGDWKAQWTQAMEALWPNGAAAKHAVAVAYADWRAASALSPGEVLRAAVEVGCPALLVDTWDKTAGSLFDHWPVEEVGNFVVAAQSQGLMLVLAGSLRGEGFSVAARLRPDLVAVRAAACESGRRGTVSRGRVAGLREAIGVARRVGR